MEWLMVYIAIGYVWGVYAIIQHGRCFPDKTELPRLVSVGLLNMALWPLCIIIAAITKGKGLRWSKEN